MKIYFPNSALLGASGVAAKPLRNLQRMSRFLVLLPGILVLGSTGSDVPTGGPQNGSGFLLPSDAVGSNEGSGVAPAEGVPSLQAGTDLQSPIYDVALKPACDTCTITVEKVVRLGRLAGPGQVSEENTFASIHPDGRYYVYAYSRVRSGRVHVFSPDGDYLESFGGAGQGPGEYQGISAVRFGDDGRVFVYDRTTHRATILDAENNVLKTIPMPITPGLGSWPVGDDRTVIATSGRTASAIGWPLHLVSGEGRLEASFGSADELVFPGRATVERVTPSALRAPEITFWGTPTRRYEIALIGLLGGPYKTLRRRPMHSTLEVRDSRAPRLAIYALEEDSDGLLWVFMEVPDPNWEQNIAAPQGLHTGGFEGPSSKYLDSLVEVLDPASGELLATVRLDNWVVPAGRSRVTAVVDDDEDLWLDVWQLSLQDTRGR